ncbi:major facilitator superfamily domain-containing protein 6-like isoform X2 [Cardiocondyla obscurior]|uniref:major facilitator superfamily domain-containing protein 6-like isoform X2 n=1 Tax=Cardiocondyla obscurior TaxID=286306 RepID=UPI0039656862
MKINYTYLNVKVHYFFFMAAMGAINLYVPVYGKQLGISPLIVGGIIAILPVGSFIGKLLFGYAVDRFLNSKKTIFMIVIASTGISYASIYFLPALPSPILPDHQYQNISYNSLSLCNTSLHASTVASCSDTKDTTCHWMCKDTNFSVPLSFRAVEREAIISRNTTCVLNANGTLFHQGNATINDNCNVTCDNFKDDPCLYKSVTFWGFVILFLFGHIGFNICTSVNDAICFDILGEDGQVIYGRQRLWGSIGFSFLTLISGYTIDLWSEGKIYKTYTPAFILVFIFICIDLTCFKRLKLPLIKSPNILKDVYTVLKLMPIIIFQCTVFIAGIFECLTINFVFWLIEDLAMATGNMNKVKLIQGLTISAAFLGSKVIFFFMSGKILKKFGYGYTITFCFLAFALRLGSLSLVSSPWYVVLVEICFQGPTFALLHSTIVTYASVIAPPGTSATVQAITIGIKEGLGYAVGGLLAGYLIKKVGSSMTFRIYAGLAALSALLYFIIYVSYLKHTMTVIDIRNNVEWRKPADARRDCATDET